MFFMNRKDGSKYKDVEKKHDLIFRYMEGKLAPSEIDELVDMMYDTAGTNFEKATLYMRDWLIAKNLFNGSDEVRMATKSAKEEMKKCLLSKV